MRALGKAEPTQLPITSLSRHLVTAREPGVKNINQAAGRPWARRSSTCSEPDNGPPATSQLISRRRCWGQISDEDVIRPEGLGQGARQPEQGRGPNTQTNLSRRPLQRWGQLSSRDVKPGLAPTRKVARTWSPRDGQGCSQLRH